LDSGDTATPIMVKILRFDGVSVDIELLAAPFAFAGMKDIHFILRDTGALEHGVGIGAL
jgi:hypothetical protein